MIRPTKKRPGEAALRSSKQNKHMFTRFCFAMFGVVALAQTAEALPFVFQSTDLALGFRKTGANQENYEVVVDIGQASNYVFQTMGTTVNVTNYSTAQLTGSFVDLNNLTWAVVGAYTGSSYPGYPNYTLWVTVPRTNNSIQSQTPYRFAQTIQQQVRPWIVGIFSHASTISSGTATNQFNTSNFIRESIASFPNDILTKYIGGVFDDTTGTLHDTWPPDEPNSGNLEITTPASFSSAVRQDLYEVRPDGFADPNTGSSTGSAYFIGYFQLNTDGSMTFTRASAGSPPPPPPPIVSIVRSGTVSTVSFGTTNGATYTLYYTNLSGLGSPITTWSFNPTTVMGDGTTKQFIDTTSDANRIYRVGAQ